MKVKRGLVTVVLIFLIILSGCTQAKEEKDDHLTVFLWESRLIKYLVPYIREQFPDKDIEFIAGNNDTDLYSYYNEHGQLPDIITVRRYSGTDAIDLRDELLDLSAYDIVTKYYIMHFNITIIAITVLIGYQYVVFLKLLLPIRPYLIDMILRFQQTMKNM